MSMPFAGHVWPTNSLSCDRLFAIGALAAVYRNRANPPTLGAMTGPHASFGDFSFDGTTLRRDGEPVALGSRGTALLSALVAADGGLVGKEALMQAVWPGTWVEESNVTVQVAALRKVSARSQRSSMDRHADKAELLHRWDETAGSTSPLEGWLGIVPRRRRLRAPRAPAA